MVTVVAVSGKIGGVRVVSDIAAVVIAIGVTFVIDRFIVAVDGTIITMASTVQGPFYAAAMAVTIVLGSLSIVIFIDNTPFNAAIHIATDLFIKNSIASHSNHCFQNLQMTASWGEIAVSAKLVSTSTAVVYLPYASPKLAITVITSLW